MTITVVLPSRNPWLIEEWNEPPGEQTFYSWVEEEEASAMSL
jgi:hypothetical protein